MAASARALVVRAHTKIQTNSKEVPKSLSRNTKPFSKQILYICYHGSLCPSTGGESFHENPNKFRRNNKITKKKYKQYLKEIL